MLYLISSPVSECDSADVIIDTSHIEGIVLFDIFIKGVLHFGVCITMESGSKIYEVHYLEDTARKSIENIMYVSGIMSTHANAIAAKMKVAHHNCDECERTDGVTH